MPTQPHAAPSARLRELATELQAEAAAAPPPAAPAGAAAGAAAAGGKPGVPSLPSPLAGPSPAASGSAGGSLATAGSGAIATAAAPVASTSQPATAGRAAVRWQERPKPSLHARAFLRLGMWQWALSEGLDANAIKSIIHSFETATR